MVERKRIGRRSFITLAIGTGSLLGLAACSQAPAAAPSAKPAAAPTAAPAGQPASAAKSAAPAATVKSAGDPQPGGKLRVAVSSDPPDLTANGDNSPGTFMFKIFETLVAYGPNSQPVPRLAESWESPN